MVIACYSSDLYPRQPNFAHLERRQFQESEQPWVVLPFCRVCCLIARDEKYYFALCEGKDATLVASLAFVDFMHEPPKFTDPYS